VPPTASLIRRELEQALPADTSSSALTTLSAATPDSVDVVTRVDLEAMEARLTEALTATVRQEVGAVGLDSTAVGSLVQRELEQARTDSTGPDALAELSRQVEELAQLVRQRAGVGADQVAPPVTTPVNVAVPTSVNVAASNQPGGPVFGAVSGRLGSSRIRDSGTGFGGALDVSLFDLWRNRIHPYLGFQASTVPVQGVIGGTQYEGDVTSVGGVLGASLDLVTIGPVRSAFSAGLAGIGGSTSGNTAADESVVDNIYIYGGFVMGPKVSFDLAWSPSTSSGWSVLTSIGRRWAGARGGWSFHVGFQWLRGGVPVTGRPLFLTGVPLPERCGGPSPHTCTPSGLIPGCPYELHPSLVQGPTMSSTADLTRLSPDFSGTLLVPGDPGYEEARKVHNGLVDRRPTVIAGCQSTQDVVRAVRYAQEQGLEIAVRGGGHNVAGRATVDGGMMIDLSGMKSIEVDPASRTARAQGGSTWAEFNEATQKHGLACTGGAISTTGVAGLTLGGGWGWLQGKYGLSLDNLIAVEMVLADGRVVGASENENPELFWAVRGAGANFGVAVSLTFRLHEVGPTVVGGLVAYPFAKAGEVLRYYGEFVRELPDELSMGAGVLHAPDGSGTKLVALLAGWCGPVDEGLEAVRPLKELGDVAMDALGPIPYSDLNKMLDAGFPKGALNYWKSAFVREVSDGAVDAVVDAFAACPVPLSGVLFERWHGAMQRVPADATAYGLRDHGHNVLMLAEWLDPELTGAGVAWARESFAALESHRAPGNYVNYLGDDASTADVAAAYGPNYARLAELKAEYDPENVFHRNQNIPPVKRRAEA
jgi:FAD/FMN-containing dehydrogenase